MVADYEARSRYLSLALDARRLIDLLLAFVQSGERAADFERSVGDIIESLQSMGSAETLLASFQTRLPVRNYEQITTWDEVIPREARNELAGKLAVLLAETGTSESQQQSAMETIRFLYDVESRALHHFNEPGSSQFSAAFAI
jgi:hypothetical protein